MRAYYIETIGLKQLFYANGDEYEVISINVEDGSYKKAILTEEEYYKIYDFFRDVFDSLGEVKGSRMVRYE